MVKKYAHALEKREINNSTGEIWTINDVPNLWRAKVEAQLDKDGYVVDEDGTVIKKPEDEKPEKEE